MSFPLVPDDFIVSRSAGSENWLNLASRREARDVAWLFVPPDLYSRHVLDDVGHVRRKDIALEHMLQRPQPLFDACFKMGLVRGIGRPAAVP